MLISYVKLDHALYLINYGISSLGQLSCVPHNTNSCLPNELSVIILSVLILLLKSFLDGEYVIVMSRAQGM